MQMTRAGTSRLISCLVACLIACGGGGDDGDTPDAQIDDIDGAIATDATPAPDSAIDSDAGNASRLDMLLAALRADTAGALLAQANDEGWPAPVEGGYLFVTSDPNLDRVGGDHDGWQGTSLTPDDGFQWVVLDVPAGNRYKFTNLTDWVGDPWSRAYEWDQFGLMSMLPPTAAHLERFFAQGAPGLAERTIRVWVPEAPTSHVLYVHDGQNLFNPSAIWGGWRLQESAPAGMMIVGIDNTGARFEEYTHTTDVINGSSYGGQGDAYADFVQDDIRSLIRDHYGEPARVGVMGSSLGGLISLHIADRFRGQYDFAASLSGTVGWGSIGAGVTNQTMIERYDDAGLQSTALYIDSGGGGTCVDSDGDGIMDDAPDGLDNYCENLQLRDTLVADGYTFNTDLWHWYEDGAPHNEAAWAARVWRPLDLFAAL